MDSAGAEQIRQRIEQHVHWRQASAVVAGTPSPVDPDRDELEELGPNTRVYGVQQRHEIVDGTHALSTYRLHKRLVGGHWERELVLENVQQVA